MRREAAEGGRGAWEECVCVCVCADVVQMCYLSTLFQLFQMRCACLVAKTPDIGYQGLS